MSYRGWGGSTGEARRFMGDIHGGCAKSAGDIQFIGIVGNDMGIQESGQII